MRFDPQAGVIRSDEDPSERRNRGRMPQEALECDLGPVLDLSGGGMRVLTRKNLKKGDELTVVLNDSHVKVALRTRIAWVKKAGFFKHEVGLEFISLTDELARTLTRICTNHRMRRVC